MKRISATLLLSAVVLTGSYSTANGQTSSGWSPWSLGRKMPAGTSQPAQGASQNARAPAGPSAMPATVQDDSLQLAALQSRPVAVSAQPNTGQGGINAQLVNSRNLVIDFELKGAGPSGVSNVELWYTLDGQSWSKYPGGRQLQSPFVVDVTDDGLYGFTVVATNGMGIGRTPPQPGDPPHMWVDVDTTRPEVHLLSTEAGLDANGRTLTLRWTATDRNLVARPITLAYAERSEGPWIPFATNLENVGSFTWRLSPGMPNQVIVRVTATDRVGNVGLDQSTMPTPVDLSRPTVTIKNVSKNGVILPAGGN